LDTKIVHMLPPAVQYRYRKRQPCNVWCVCCTL